MRKYRIRKHDFSDGVKYSIEHTCHTNDDWEAVGYMEECLFTGQVSFKRKQFDTIEEAREWIEKDKMNIGVVVEEY